VLLLAMAEQEPMNHASSSHEAEVHGESRVSTTYDMNSLLFEAPYQILQYHIKSLAVVCYRIWFVVH
jgi:hypothetical protein